MTVRNKQQAAATVQPTMLTRSSSRVKITAPSNIPRTVAQQQTGTLPTRSRSVRALNTPDDPPKATARKVTPKAGPSARVKQESQPVAKENAVVEPAPVKEVAQVAQKQSSAVDKGKNVDREAVQVSPTFHCPFPKRV